MTEKEIVEAVAKLTNEQKSRLKMLLAKILGAGEGKNYSIEERFRNGLICPRCKARRVSRNGRRRGVQRYVCRSCGSTFNAATGTVLAATKKSVSVWECYVECMVSGLSVRMSAEKCGISKSTSFIWRHKLLDALREKDAKAMLRGIVEGDEAFFRLSFKGNHARDGFRMPRPARKRGGCGKRGMSSEQVCAPCAVERGGAALSKAACLGRATARALGDVFGGKIDGGATFCSDAHASYRAFAAERSVRLVQTRGGRAKSGIYHTQHVSAYHSVLKGWMRRFRGVATKYLDNYLAWNNALNWPGGASTERRNDFLVFVLTALKRVLSKNVSKRPAVPFRV